MRECCRLMPGKKMITGMVNKKLTFFFRESQLFLFDSEFLFYFACTEFKEFRNAPVLHGNAV